MPEYQQDTLAPVKVFGVAGKYITTQNLQAALAFSYGSDVADGAELTEYTVSELLDGLPIHAYVTLDFDGISKMNELVGGVTVKAMEDLDRADIRQGETVTPSGAGGILCDGAQQCLGGYRNKCRPYGQAEAVHVCMVRPAKGKA